MVLLAVLVWPAVSFGQDASAIDPNHLITRAAIARSAAAATAGVRFDQAQPAQPIDPRRACDGCPIRRIGRPLLETLGINILYNGINRLRGHESAQIGPKTWADNLKSGFEWDTNTWRTNQFGHPYQGSNYYTAARSNGLTYWESTGIAALGSGMWEYFFEANRASLNDLINTTLGGIALGEVMHRSAWLVRDPSKTSGRREVWAAAIDPMSGLERSLSGDWSRVAQKPKSEIPASLGWQVDVGVLGQSTSSLQAVAAAGVFVDSWLFYGNVRRGYSKTPFEAFTLEIAAGSDLGHAQIHGRLFGSPFGKNDAYQFTIFQTYDYIHNPAYDFGGQGFEAEVSTTRGPKGHWSVWLAATGGATVLAAANSLLEPSEGDPLPAYSEERTYDYGPGARMRGVIEIQHNAYPIVLLDYQAFHVNVVDGTRANHILQRLKLDLRAPVSRDFSVGATVEYFYREAYFWTASTRTTDTRTDESTQIRLFVTWSRR